MSGVATSSTLPVATGRATAAALGRAVVAQPRAAVEALAWTWVASIGTVAVPLVLGRLIDAVRGADARQLVALIAVLGVAAVVQALGTGIATRAVQRLGVRVVCTLREHVLTRALALPQGLVERVGIGDVASRVSEDLETFVEAVPVIAQVATAAVTVAVAAAAFLTLDWRLAASIALVVPVYAVALRWYLRRAGHLYAAERSAAAERSRVLLRTLLGSATIAAYDMAALHASRIRTASGSACETALTAARFSLWLTKAVNLAEVVGLCAVLAVGSWLVRDHAVTVGAVAAAALLFHRLFEPLGDLVGSVDEVQRAGAALGRAVGVTGIALDGRARGRAPQGPARLSARGIRHRYADGDEVLHGIDLDVSPGRTLAIVGASGAGKTTLAAILSGVIAASAGDVTLGDELGTVALRELDELAARSWIAMASQDAPTFSGTVRDNLTLAAPDADDTALRAALRRVGAGPWLDGLADGLGTDVSPGAHPLGPAERQLLALARLLLRDVPVVVLDEATAEAGSTQARLLDRAAAGVTAGRTVVIVAHRLSQARACDRIAVMRDGVVVQSGTHDELLADDGPYRELWSAWERSRAPG